MCRKIVEYHGGRIWLDTDYGHGARFRFTLPIVEDQGPTMNANLISVLLVDDDPGDVLLDPGGLRRPQGRQRRCRSSATASRRCGSCAAKATTPSATRPDLILLDLNLPRKSGVEVLEEIKSDPRAIDDPGVVLTTSEAEEDVVRAYKLHANAYITKPVDFEQFSQIVHQIDDFFIGIVKLPPAI